MHQEKKAKKKKIDSACTNSAAGGGAQDRQLTTRPGQRIDKTNKNNHTANEKENYYCLNRISIFIFYCNYTRARAERVLYQQDPRFKASQPGKFR